MTMTPEERQQKIETYGNGPTILVEALKEFPSAMWRYKPAPNEWCIHEIIIHIVDGEAHSYARLRKAIAETGSTIMLWDQPAWSQALHYADQSVDDALALFTMLRCNTFNLIKTLPEATWANTYIHPVNGTVTLDDWLNIYVGHVRNHIVQMQEVHTAWAKQQQP